MSAAIVILSGLAALIVVGGAFGAGVLVGFGVARRRYRRKRKRPEILVQAISGYAFNPGPIVAEILKEATRE